MRRVRKHLPARVGGDIIPGELLSDLRGLIARAREQTARALDAGLVAAYWSVGERIRREVLREGRADYGEQIVATLSQQLTREFGRGFTYTNLTRMIRFAEVFPDPRIVSTLSAQLGWSHFVEIIPLEGDLQRDFYAEMCRVERWSVRTLRAKIASMLYERTALSRKPGRLARQELDALRETDQMSPDLVFRDPYVLDFLGLKDTFSEKDLETAILREIERFLLELGTDFAFVARQKRISVGGADYHLDLLFYHRRLRCLVALELKLGKFQPADTGQIELYLRWLDEHERLDGENPPVAIVLCGGKDNEQVSLLRLDAKGIRIAEYLTDMPSRHVLAGKLHQAIRLAREQLVRRQRPGECREARCGLPAVSAPLPIKRRAKG
jgi:predicted nuclease of restriction endonuclease-like (RecB) superfamily